MRIVRCAVVVILFASCAALGAPVTWTLQNVTFTDGATATGSFVYDAATNTLSQASISISGGDTNTFPPLTYVYPNGNVTSIGGAPPNAVFLGTLVSLRGPTSAAFNNRPRDLRIDTVTPLTDAGGTIQINTATNSVECFNCNPFRTFSSGSFVAPFVSGGITVVPESIHANETATLTWSSTNGNTVTINDGTSSQTVAAQGSMTVSPAKTTKYTLSVQGSSTSTSSSTTLTFLGSPPNITTFVANGASSRSDGSVTATLSWASTGGTSASIDNGIGPVTPASGNAIVLTARTTSYTLTVKGAGGTATRTLSVIVSNKPAPAVSTFAGTGQPGSADGPAFVASFTRPFAVSIGPRNSSGKGLSPAENDSASFDMFVLDSNHTIRKISPDGTTITWVGKAGVRGSANGNRTAATFDFSNYLGAIVANSDGSLEVFDANGLQRHVDASGNVTTACPTCARFPLPSGMAILRDRTVYVADAGNHTVTRISPSGVTTVIGTAGQPGYRDGLAGQAQFNRPRGMTVDTAGNVYVLDTGNNAIRKISAANVVSTMTISDSAGAGGSLTMGCCDSGISPAPGGGVYITDPGSNTIKEVGASGTITTIAGSGSSGSGNGAGAGASFNGPLGVATAPDGSLVVTDTNGNTVRSVEAPPGPRRHAAKH